MSDTDVRIARLERLSYARDGVAVGAGWKVTARPWPTDGSPECLVFQSFQGRGWRDVLVLSPDGTLQPA